MAAKRTSSQATVGGRPRRRCCCAWRRSWRRARLCCTGPRPFATQTAPIKITSAQRAGLLPTAANASQALPERSALQCQRRMAQTTANAPRAGLGQTAFRAARASGETFASHYSRRQRRQRRHRSSSSSSSSSSQSHLFASWVRSKSSRGLCFRARVCVRPVQPGSLTTTAILHPHVTLAGQVLRLRKGRYCAYAPSKARVRAVRSSFGQRSGT